MALQTHLFIIDRGGQHEAFTTSTSATALAHVAQAKESLLTVHPRYLC